MIIGKYTIDPRRIVSADFELKHIINNIPIYEFSIRYLIANQLDLMPQLGTLEECVKWSKQVNKYIGKDSLIDAIATQELPDEDDVDDDGEKCEKKRLGFYEEK